MLYSLHTAPLPIAIENITVTRVNGTVLKVEWEPLTLVQARGFIESYTVSYEAVSDRVIQKQTVARREAVTVSADQTEVELDGLNPTLNYAITVTAANGAGNSSSDKVLASGKMFFMLYEFNCKATTVITINLGQCVVMFRMVKAHTLP